MSDLTLSSYALEEIRKRLSSALQGRIFKTLTPSIYQSRFNFATQVSNKNNIPISSIRSKDYYESISDGIYDAYSFQGKKITLELKDILTPEKIYDLENVIECYNIIMDKEKMMLLSEELDEEMEYPDLNEMDNEDADEEDYDNEDDLKSDEQIKIALNSKFFTDIIKIQDKYTIRIGDGKYYVASDKVSIVFRDPSDRPSWAVWFLEAVPLTDIPSHPDLLLMSDKDKKKYCPTPLPDQPIICHASLWSVKDNKSGVLLHVSWNHISSTYRWIINKPLDIASILFKAVGHPAHLARNFGYSPNLAIPGDSWF